MNKKTLLLFFAFSLTMTAANFGQYSVENFDLNGTIGPWYDSIFSGNKPELYEGSFYEIPARTIDGHAFLGTGQWGSGSIDFRGQLYEEVFLLYDLINDVLLIRNTNLVPEGREFMRINPLQVASFDLEGLHFEQYGSDTCPATGPGFYHIIYRSDALSLIAKRSKQIRSTSTGLSYDSEIRYFLEVDEGFVNIRGKRDVYKFFENDKKEIRRFIRQNRLSIVKGNDGDYRRLISFCAGLMKS